MSNFLKFVHLKATSINFWRFFKNELPGIDRLFYGFEERKLIRTVRSKAHLIKDCRRQTLLDYYISCLDQEMTPSCVNCKPLASATSTVKILKHCPMSGAVTLTRRPLLATVNHCKSLAIFTGRWCGCEERELNVAYGPMRSVLIKRTQTNVVTKFV